VDLPVRPMPPGIIYHAPVWEPADVPVGFNEEEVVPGFMCTHPLENGNGICGGTTLSTEDSGDHACYVPVLRAGTVNLVDMFTCLPDNSN
jgi:hypothetical protein